MCATRATYRVAQSAVLLQNASHRDIWPDTYIDSYQRRPLTRQSDLSVQPGPCRRPAAFRESWVGGVATGGAGWRRSGYRGASGGECLVVVFWWNLRASATTGAGVSSDVTRSVARKIDKYGVEVSRFRMLNFVNSYRIRV